MTWAQTCDILLSVGLLGCALAIVRLVGWVRKLEKELKSRANDG